MSTIRLVGAPLLVECNPDRGFARVADDTDLLGAMDQMPAGMDAQPKRGLT
jgi:hypothetical protein